MRYERKYQIHHLSKAAVEQAIRLHPAGFRKIFPHRQVNNIYFDTPDHQTFRHNMDGINQRKKYRLRWYGDDLQTIKNPRFEIKIKHNELGMKEVVKFHNTQLVNLSPITSQINDLTAPSFSNKLLALSPTLLNTYQRSYYGTSNGHFRITVDWDLQFYPMLYKGAFGKNPFFKKMVILECKYEAKKDATAQQILKYLPFRQTKNSKYVTGILLTQS